MNSSQEKRPTAIWQNSRVKYLLAFLLLGLLCFVPQISCILTDRFFKTTKVVSLPPLSNHSRLDKGDPIPVFTETTLDIDKISDVVINKDLDAVYVRGERNLSLRETPAIRRQLLIRISWRPIAYKELLFQLSADEKFLNITDSFRIDPLAGQGSFRSVTVGRNYIRFSSDGVEWFRGPNFEVREYTNSESPKLFVQEVMKESLRPVPYTLIASHNIHSKLGTIFAISYSAAFEPNLTRVAWSDKNKLAFSDKSGRDFYVRARTVQQDWQISSYSQAIRVNAQNAKNLAMGKNRVKPSGSVKANNDAVALKLFLREENPGKKPIDQTSSNEIAIQKKVNRRIATVEQVAKEPAGQEGQSSAGSLSLKKETSQNIYPNRSYIDSKLTFEGAAFTVYSQENVDENRKEPVALTMALKTLNWFGIWGLEGGIKSKIAEVKKSEGDVSPLLMELKAHRRWSTNFNPFSRIRRSQISVFGGYEFYRNSSVGPYAPQYDLLTTGMSFHFPVLDKFDTGGQLAYGRGFDSSEKYELQGFIGYYLTKNFSVGAGYRVHLFVSGSERTSPAGQGYREGFGEGYTSFSWLY